MTFGTCLSISGNSSFLYRNYYTFYYTYSYCSQIVLVAIKTSIGICIDLHVPWTLSTTITIERNQIKIRILEKLKISKVCLKYCVSL
jgi:uncharacterized protein YycO